MKLMKHEASDPRQSGDITTGLVSHWPMDEETGKAAKDVVSGNQGVFEKGEPEWVKGRIGKGALRFSESCYLNCGMHESLNMTKAMTFAAWIKKSIDDRESRMAFKHGFMNEKNCGWLVLCGGPGKANIEWRISITGEDWRGGFTTPNSFPYDEMEPSCRVLRRRGHARAYQWGRGHGRRLPVQGKRPDSSCKRRNPSRAGPGSWPDIRRSQNVVVYRVDG